jgi:hypothetical protein
LTKELNKADKLRIELNQKLVTKEGEAYQLQKEKNELVSTLTIQGQKIGTLKSETQKLKKTNEKYDISLQKAIEVTNENALEMDRATEHIKEYESENLRQEQRIKTLKTKSDRQFDIIAAKEKQIH